MAPCAPITKRSVVCRPVLAPLRVPPQHLPAGAGGGGGHQQQQRVRLRLPGQRPQLQPLHLQAQRQVLQRAGRQGAAFALPQVQDDEEGQNMKPESRSNSIKHRFSFI